MSQPAEYTKINLYMKMLSIHLQMSPSRHALLLAGEIYITVWWEENLKIGGFLTSGNRVLVPKCLTSLSDIGISGGWIWPRDP